MDYFWTGAGTAHHGIRDREYIQTVENCLHHGEGQSSQNVFKQQVLALIEAIRDFGNPFLEDSHDLLTLDTQNVMHESVIETVRIVESLGKEEYNKYHDSVLSKCECSIHKVIPKNRLALFRCGNPKSKTKHAKTVY